MHDEHLQSQSPEDDQTPRVGSFSMIELGEKLYQWRHYTAVPALMLLLLFAHPTARSATIGTLLILLGTVIRVYTVAFTGTENKDVVAMDELVTTGPFALVRNPLYIGNMMITFGVICYAGIITLGLMLLALFAFQYYCVTKYEENTLLAKFGDEYQRYMDRVPAWIPLKTPLAEDFPVPPSISAAFVAERKALAIIGIILFLLILAAH
jgi:protein-S-isoprenylcysteine O-methyltransferase Ste14